MICLKLMEIKMGRILKFNSEKADQSIAALNEQLEQIKNHLSNIVNYTIDWFTNLKEKYGKNYPRRTEIRSFDTIEVTKVIEANQKLYINKEEGFIGTALKKDEFVCNCSEIDDVIVFYKNQPTYNPQLERGKPYKITRDKKERDYEVTNAVMRETTTVNEGTRLPKRIIKINQERGMHPTQKPVALFEYLIKTYTNEGETVLDNCMGSGTTAIAAHNTGRFFIGIEKEPKYVEIARQRLEQAQIEGD